MGILLAGGMMYGWSAMGRQKAVKQTEAIEAITAAGGTVFMDYQWKDGQFQADGEPQQAAWVRRLVGPEMLDRAVAVDLSQVDLSADVVRRLPLMPHMVDLNAAGTRMDDDALKTVRRLGRLTHLCLSGTMITDQGVDQLSRLTRLTVLSLAATDVSDRSVEALGGLTSLRRLDVSSTKLSGGAVARLRAALPKCRIVHP